MLSEANGVSVGRPAFNTLRRGGPSPKRVDYRALFLWTVVSNMSSEVGASEVPSRTAILLHGLLRDFAVTAPSLLRHLVAPGGASIFYFGPTYSDRPAETYSGFHDRRGFLARNPKTQVDEVTDISGVDLRKVYGPSLAAWRFHEVPQNDFIEVASDLLDREDWLFGMNPYRILSMFFNIQGVVRLLMSSEREAGCTFDRVVIARPDLAFYAPISVWAGTDEVHLPSGEGLLKDGRKPIGNAPIYFYKNALTGDYSPNDRSLGFNDQLMVLSRSSLGLLENAFVDVADLLASRAPASPETLLYLLLVSRGRLNVVEHPEWVYEIFRSGAVPFRSVLDLPSLAEVDPYHPLVTADDRVRAIGE